MAIRYTVDALFQLRESPLCVRPNLLPPSEEWMGPPAEAVRSTPGNRTDTARNRNADPLLDQTNRRQGADRHLPRSSSANPEDLVLGPQRGQFPSSSLSKSRPFDSDKPFGIRPKNGDGENPGGLRDRDRDRERDGRGNNYRRNGGDTDQDSEGWSTVKPRKSFGHEGAERYNGRPSDRDRPERLGNDRRPRDQEDRDNKDRASRRPFGEFGRDKDAEDADRPRRNGLNKNRTEQPSWGRENTNNEAPAPRERFDRGKSWRDRGERDNHHGDERQSERTYERKWDRERDHRQEREPEWLDEPAEEPSYGRTEDDMKKFLAAMKNKDAGGADKIDTSATPAEIAEAEKTKMKSAPAMELGPDKFFAAFASSASGEAGTASPEATKDSIAPRPRGGKSGSRFQNFFSSQEEARRQTEPPTPAAEPHPAEVNPLLAFAKAASANPPGGPGGPSDSAEKVAFQALLQKLQKQQPMPMNTPPSSGFSEPPAHESGPRSAITSPGPYPQFGQERREELAMRGPPPPHHQDIHSPRPQQNIQQPPMRPEQQMLHDLIGQRHIQNQPSGRADHNPSRSTNSNAEFLMTLMQSARNAPEPSRTEQLVMRMPQPSRPAHIPPAPDREPEFQRERSASQHQGRPTGLPSFFDEPQMRHHEPEGRPPQPTQILQRQPPPGLEQHPPPSWMQQGGQQLPPQGRPMIPPPGLAGNARNGPMPGGMFPPNFPMGAGFPPPEQMMSQHRNMAPPPGFFGGPPPPGFMPPPGVAGGFPGHEPVGFGFDGRGMPPSGAGGFRRN